MWPFLGCGLLDISIFVPINLKRNQDEAERRFFSGIAKSIAIGLGWESPAYFVGNPSSVV
jgi:hypothetical protein